MRRKLIGLIAGLGLAVGATVAHAATAALSIYQVPNNANPALATGGTYFVYVAVSQDNDGLADYDIDVLGTGGAVVNGNPTLKAPHPSDGSSQYADGNGGTMGFNFENSVGANSGTGRAGIVSFQDIPYGANDDTSFDMGIFVGVGQENSSASPQDGEQGPGGPTGISTPVWTYVTPGTLDNGYAIGGTLIEQGVYTYTSGNQNSAQNAAAGLTVQVHPGNFVQVLSTADNGTNEAWSPFNPGQSALSASVVTPDSILINTPEPASLGLLGAGLGFIGLGRGFRRKTA